MSFSRKTMLLAFATAPLLSVSLAVNSLDGIGMGWADSYSIGGRCYCQTTYDHNIGGIMVQGPGGSQITVRKACELAGSGPQELNGQKRVYYNTVQCGNDPKNDFWDEEACPGRVDLGRGNASGCKTIGPKWYFGPAAAASMQAPTEPTLTNPPRTNPPPTNPPATNPPATNPPPTNPPPTNPPPTNPPTTNPPTTNPPPTNPPPANPPATEPAVAPMVPKPMTASAPMPPPAAAPVSMPPASSDELFDGVAAVDIVSLEKTTFPDLMTATIKKSDYPNGFTLEALTKDPSAISSILFKWTREKTERVAPYVMTGNHGDDFNAWNIQAGTTTSVMITATGKDGSTETIATVVKVI